MFHYLFLRGFSFAFSIENNSLLLSFYEIRWNNYLLYSRGDVLLWEHSYSLCVSSVFGGSAKFDMNKNKLCFALGWSGSHHLGGR